MASKICGLVCHLSAIVIILASSAVGQNISKAFPNASHSPFCRNPFSSVMVKRWVNGAEEESLIGLSASFGSLLPPNIKDARRLSVVFANPLNCCSPSSSNLAGSVTVALRGDCDFTYKAQVAQEGGAKGLLVINDDEGLIEMNCSEKDMKFDIAIPVVTISKSGGATLKDQLTRLTERRSYYTRQFAPLWTFQ